MVSVNPFVWWPFLICDTESMGNGHSIEAGRNNLTAAFTTAHCSSVIVQSGWRQTGS